MAKQTQVQLWNILLLGSALVICAGTVILQITPVSPVIESILLWVRVGSGAILFLLWIPAFLWSAEMAEGGATCLPPLMALAVMLVTLASVGLIAHGTMSAGQWQTRVGNWMLSGIAALSLVLSLLLLWGIVRGRADYNRRYAAAIQDPTYHEKIQPFTLQAVLCNNMGWETKGVPDLALDGDTLLVRSAYSGPTLIFQREEGQWRQTARLKAWDKGFPSSAVSGDTILLGAPGAKSGLGAADVYVRCGDVWKRQVRLTMPGFRNVGCEVDLSGDTAALIGEIGEAPGDRERTVGVFKRMGEQWHLQTHLTAKDIPGLGTNRFGTTLSISNNTIVVGVGCAPLGDKTSTDLIPASDHAYVYTRDNDTWQRTAMLLPKKVERFPKIVVHDDIVVMQATTDAIYVFQRHGADWNLHTTLVAPSGILFQGSVKLAIDKDTVALRAWFAGKGPTRMGVCVYRRSADTWSYETTLVPLGNGYDTSFGGAIAVSGNTIAVRTSQSESAYVFVRE